MKKAGIVTLYGNVNYGNRLQNLAVQTILEDHGFKVESIVFTNNHINRWKYIFRLNLKGCLKKDAEALRTLHFVRFNRKHIRIKYIYGTTQEIPPRLLSRYDYFAVGSDQVWNIRMKEVMGKAWFYFLDFTEDKKKVCISPSIGVGLDTIPVENQVKMRRWLSGFRYLCCREKQGAEEIARLTGKECQWLIDPTLYVPREQWERILSLKPSKSVPYVFLFFIDGISKELKSFIDKYAASGGFKIIDASDPSGNAYSAGPVEFVELITNAHMVFTDSFHATVFSINFHVPFYVFNRNKIRNMTSRIESISEAFSLKDRYIREQKPFDIQETCSFEAADQQLILERKKFSDYLDKCFEE